MTKITHVAVAILQNTHGDFLMASRPPGKPWAGWWEFPGGKIEENETPERALIRELKEELGIMSTRIQPWLQRVYDYPAISQHGHDSPAKTVHLHFFFVTDWQGELHPHEGQQLSWQSAENLTVEPILPANAPIMKALALPPIYAISNVAEMGEIKFLAALKTQLKNGLKIIQLREQGLKQLPCDPITMRLAEQVISLSRTHGAKVLLNSDLNLALALGADGVHLPSKSLLALTAKPANLPNNFLMAASCHNAIELTHAEKLGLDFVVLSPVNPSKSHASAATLGWEKFAALMQTVEIPSYALGGMTLQDLPQALQCGARGVAMQRAVWV